MTSSSSPLLELVGRMKVEALARLVGVTVEDVAAAVLQRASASRGAAAERRASAAVARAVAGARERAAGPAPAVVALAQALLRTAPGEPPLAQMLGRASYPQIRVAFDRWLLGRAFDEHRGTVIGVARRLYISRRNVRERWARAQASGPDEWLGQPGEAIPAPAPPSLTAIYESGGTYGAVREAMDRWLIGSVLAHEEGNLSRASRRLGMPRTQLRKRWARVRPKG